MGCHFLLQGTFLTQGSNLSLLSQPDNTLSLTYLGGLVTIQSYYAYFVCVSVCVYVHAVLLNSLQTQGL